MVTTDQTPHWDLMNDYPNILVYISEITWQTSATPLRLIRRLDGKLNEHTHTLKKPFTVIVDAAPCHASAEYRAEVKKEMPWAWHAYVAAGYTSCAVRRPACKSFAEDCLANVGHFSIAVGLAANRPTLPIWLHDAMDCVMQRGSIHNKPWRPCLEQALNDLVQKDLEKDAKELGTLFRPGKGELQWNWLIIGRHTFRRGT
eukprot:4402615-Amphidinium_carterae.2